MKNSKQQLQHKMWGFDAHQNEDYFSQILTEANLGHPWPNKGYNNREKSNGCEDVEQTHKNSQRWTPPLQEINLCELVKEKQWM